MKFSALFTVLLVLTLSAPPAHAAGDINGLVTKINGLGGGAHTNDLGDGPGGGIGPICTNSPENATLLLAILCGGGLFVGRKMGRTRLQRKAVLSVSL